MLKAFKYRRVNDFLWSSLAESELYFAEPHRLSDPYDCQVDILDTLRRAANETQDARQRTLQKLLDTDVFLKNIQDDILKFGVCCFSRTLLNALMWSHYADGHQGVCLYYEIPTRFIVDPANGIFGYSPVKYGDDALFDWLVTTNALEALLPLDAAIEVMKMALTVKGNDWAYEDEARIIRPSGGTMKIRPAFLKQICFGLRTPAAHKERLRRIVRDTYDNVQFAEIRHEGRKDFGIAAYERFESDVEEEIREAEEQG